MTREFLKAQGREADWQLLVPDENATYDEIIEINLSEVEPMVALPIVPEMSEGFVRLGPSKWTRLPSAPAPTHP